MIGESEKFGRGVLGEPSLVKVERNQRDGKRLGDEVIEGERRADRQTDEVIGRDGGFAEKGPNKRVGKGELGGGAEAEAIASRIGNGGKDEPIIAIEFTGNARGNGNEVRSGVVLVGKELCGDMGFGGFERGKSERGGI
jgi:hypothetical protein